MGHQQVGVLIVGGGITGIAVARLLQQAGYDDYVVLEAAPEAGGLCRSRVVRGHVLDIGGGHLLCSRYPEVYEFLFSHLPQDELQRFDRVSKIRLGREVIDYPIEYNLWQLPAEQQTDYLISCVQSGEAAGRRRPRTFREWVQWKLGGRIAEDYMIPYNRKLWGVEPDALDVDWLEKIPRYDLRRVVGATLDRRADSALMPSHQAFYYPKRGGFQTLFDAIYRPVKDRVRLATPVERLRRKGGNWLVNDRWSAALVVNTIPWRTFHAKMSRPPALAPELRRLQTSALVVSLHETPYGHDWQWCYEPDPEVAHHREFFIHNFAPHSAPGGVFRETNAKRFAAQPSTLHAHHNEHAYPIPVRGHAAAAARVWGAYAELGAIGVGRWGQHRYYNSDLCIREAMRLVRGFLAGGPSGAVEALASAGQRAIT